jgi:hypothetical protein
MVSGLSEPGWVPESRPVPEALTDTYERADFEPEPDEWLEIRKRLSPADLAALSKVFSIATELMP